MKIAMTARNFFMVDLLRNRERAMCNQIGNKGLLVNINEIITRLKNNEKFPELRTLLELNVIKRFMSKTNITLK